MTDEDRAKDLFFQAADRFDAGDYAGAEGLFREVLSLVPERASVLANLAAALFRQNKAGEAATTAARALALDADNAAALLVLASARLDLNRYDEALVAFDRLVALAPDDVEAWAGRARALSDLARWSDVVACCDRVLALDPGYRYVKGQRVFARLQLADWDGIEDEAAAVVADVRRSLPASPPLEFLAISDSAADQQACAAAFSATALPPSPPEWTGPPPSHRGIRVAYVSPDFGNHAVSFLIAGLFAFHDRSTFETFALSLGPDDGSEMRRSRLPPTFEHFIDVSERSDAEIVAMIRELEIDICVDLAGHGKGGRTGIFAARPAPIQVSFLGFPATMGASCYDYIIADPIVIPEDRQASYTEAVVHVPDSFQPNDARRPLPAWPPSRAEMGLPEDGFVFACFNSTYKIGPGIFAVWMRLLDAVPGSVLWLLARDAAGNDRLREEARRRGIDPGRLVFAEPLPHKQHLTRMQLADLFLDTLPFNGRATISDALWSGVPVVTCSGEAFSSRMAASLLKAIEIPELVAADLDAYEALALRLAQQPDECTSLKMRLVSTRSSVPLFDTRRFTRNLEAAYRKMRGRAKDGEPPAPITVNIFV